MKTAKQIINIANRSSVKYGNLQRFTRSLPSCSVSSLELPEIEIEIERTSTKCCMHISCVDQSEDTWSNEREQEILMNFRTISLKNLSRDRRGQVHVALAVYYRQVFLFLLFRVHDEWFPKKEPERKKRYLNIYFTSLRSNLLIFHTAARRFLYR